MNDYLPSTTSGVKGTAFKKGMVHVLNTYQKQIKLMQAFTFLTKIST